MLLFNIKSNNNEENILCKKCYKKFNTKFCHYFHEIYCKQENNFLKNKIGNLEDELRIYKNRIQYLKNKIDNLEDELRIYKKTNLSIKNKLVFL